MNGAAIPVDREDHVPVFVEQVGSAGVGTRLPLGIVRHGVRQQVEVVLQPAPKSSQEAEEYHNSDFELTVRELVFADFRAYDLVPDFRGVLVSRLEEGSWSSIGGLEVGDLIQRVDDAAIASPADLKRVLEEAAKKEARKLVFFVERDGRSQFITVQTRWKADASGVPLQPTGQGFWSQLLRQGGGLADVTEQLVHQFHTCLFGTYRCHQRRRLHTE